MKLMSQSFAATHSGGFAISSVSLWSWIWFESGGGFVEGFSADVAVGFHHLRIDVADLSLDNPVWQSFLGKRSDRGVSSVVETDSFQTGRF